MLFSSKGILISSSQYITRRWFKLLYVSHCFSINIYYNTPEEEKLT